LTLAAIRRKLSSALELLLAAYPVAVVCAHAGTFLPLVRWQLHLVSDSVVDCPIQEVPGSPNNVLLLTEPFTIAALFSLLQHPCAGPMQLIIHQQFAGSMLAWMRNRGIVAATGVLKQS
jgi:hypothetical protein